ncbi:hypothetical protein [Ensifer adhaerens]|uniref:hypothetical protein n=1 Tax=Ensifer adhaerens TaxID=106592 RepID=UPI00132EAE56|nr:hypothetical protein [Ensifer adhaerens]QHG72062.1 hypothetical protein DQW09_09955 [Ensifer adhaerens]
MPSAEIVRRVDQIARHSCTSLYTPPVCHDPIFTPLFTSLFTSIGFSAGAASFAASVATAITTTALAIGLQMLMAPKPPKPEALKVPLAQPIPYRIWAVGRTRLAGAYMLWESKGHRLFAVQAIAGHRIKSFNRYWLHDDEVTINGSGFVASPGGGRYANNSVKIQSRLGLPTETPYADAVAEFSSEGLWTNDHRGDGQASVCLFAGATRQKDQNKRFPYGVPQLSVEIDGARCWDFRDPAQNPADPNTWQWTRNSAIICAWHLCFNEFGFGLDYHKALLPVIDLWKEEADICDEDVALAGGGTEKRYECNGTDTTENGPKAGLNAILATCDGHLVSRGDGARILTVGKFRESRCAILTDADIVGHNVQYGQLFEDEINRLIPKFTYPATDYSTSDTDYFEDTSAQLTAGRVLADEAEYQWVHQWRQARRLGKRDWLRLREKVRGSIDVRLSGINSVYARWVRLETPKRLPSLNGKLIENRRSILALSKAAGFTMDIVGHPENIDAWTPATDEGKQPPVPSAPNASGIPTPVINLVQAKPKNGTVYIRVVVIDPANASLTPIVRYRVADIGAGVPGAWVEQSFPDANPSGGYINMNTNVVPSDQLLEVQAAFTTAGGAYSDWSVSEDVVSTADPTPPIALSSFTLTGAAPRLGNAAFSLSVANDGHVKSVQLYRVPAGNAFDPNTATAVGSPIAVAPSSSYSYTDGDTTRTNSIVNGGFAADSDWIKNAGWTISGGKANKAAGTQSGLTQAQSFVAGTVYRLASTVSAYSAGTGRLRFTGTTTVNGAGRTANGTYLEKMTAAAGNNTFVVLGDATFAGSYDDVIMFAETPSCAPQGVWDYYALPLNGSGVAGPVSGPLNVTII